MPTAAATALFGIRASDWRRSTILWSTASNPVGVTGDRWLSARSAAAVSGTVAVVSCSFEFFELLPLEAFDFEPLPIVITLCRNTGGFTALGLRKGPKGADQTPSGAGQINGAGQVRSPCGKTGVRGRCPAPGVRSSILYMPVFGGILQRAPGMTHRRYKERRRTGFCLLSAGVVLVAAACSSGSVPGPEPKTGPQESQAVPSVPYTSQQPAPPVTTEGSPPVTVSLDERRLNIGEGVISIRVTNHGPVPISISGAAVATPLFEGTSDWVPGPSGSSTLRPGATLALPAPLAAARCDEIPNSAATVSVPAAATVPATATAQATATGSARDATVRLTIDGVESLYNAPDPYSALARIQAQVCLERSVREVAALSLLPEVTVAPDGRTAVVHLSIVPTGKRGQILIIGAGTTTLLAENPQQPWPRNISVLGTEAPTIVELSVIPARCDPHALAEDKTGTKIPVEVTAGALSGRLRLEPSTPFTQSVYAFAASACSR